MKDGSTDEIAALRAEVERLAAMVAVLADPAQREKHDKRITTDAHNAAAAADSARRREGAAIREEERIRKLSETLRRFDERIARGDLPPIAGFGEPIAVRPWQKRGSRGYVGVPKERWAEWAKRRGETVHDWDNA